LNDLEIKIEQLLGWYSIKRKYISGLILTVIGSFVLIVDLIALVYIFPGHIVYHYNVIVYNGPFIRLCVGITMGGIGGLLLLIGLPLLIINTIKKKKLQN